jgi:hypothetical protein
MSGNVRPHHGHIRLTVKVDADDAMGVSDTRANV